MWTRFRWAWPLLLALTTLSLGAGYLCAGQFEKAVYYPAGQRPFNVVTAGFTHSGNLDLAVADYVIDQVCILLGQGNGVFKKSSCFSASLPIGLATGDFNEDGNQDLAVFESGGHGELKILLGNGKGGFKLSSRYETGIVAGGLAVADFNGDGHLDVALTDEGFESAPGDVMVFFGDGHGRLNKPTKYGMGTTGPAGIAAGDLNGDHSPDLAVAEVHRGSVAVFLNDGTGHFGKPVSYNAGGGEVADVKIANLRHDGRNDLVVANGSRGMVVLLNKGDGAFGKYTLYQPTFFNWQPPDACTVADFDLDGKLDVACNTNPYDGYLFYGKGDGTFGPGIEVHDAVKGNGGFSIASGVFYKGRGPSLAMPIELDGKVAILVNTQ
jgi:FG-GAP-like repeat